MPKIITWVKTIVFIAVCELVGVGGSFFTVKAIPAWYNQLQKPSFSPPNWVFGPVWTLLYAFQGIAAYVVFEARKYDSRARTALWLFGIQLALNAIWTSLFFGAKNLELAFYEIVVLWVFIVLSTIWFFRIRTVAGLLMLPYLAWVTFASILNYSIWQLNL